MKDITAQPIPHHAIYLYEKRLDNLPNLAKNARAFLAVLCSNNNAAK